MSRLILNPKWVADMTTKVHSTEEIDFIGTTNITIQWLVANLTRVGRTFKLYNLGAGVKRITTKTDICPCCNRKL